jgi:hypothetical protein
MGPKAIPALTEALKDESRMVRGAAEHAPKEITGRVLVQRFAGVSLPPNQRFRVL